MTEPGAIAANGLLKTFTTKDGHEIKALLDINFLIKKGEFVSIVGPSGCGKTTLLKILSGLLSPDAGRILVNGKQVQKSNGRFGYLAQADSLLPWRTVQKNVELGLEIKGIKKERRKEIARDLINRLGLAGFEKNYPFELSGGMKKRAAIMRTLAHDPEIILMDEPFSALDVHTRDFLEDDLLSIWAKTGKTIVFVTHDLAEAISLADRVFLMTARPATIKSEYCIDLPRPRTTDIRLTQEFNDILRTIWDDLRTEVIKCREIFDGRQ